MTAVDSATLLIDGPWQHRFVAANGARFHAAVAGPDDRDAPLVVLLHAVPQFWWAWRHQLPALAEAGYRAAALDLRGTGGSDKPPQGYDVPTLAADVAGVVRSLGASSAVVVGAGTGGAVAWAMPALQPAATRAVGVLSSPHPLDVVRRPWTTFRPAAARRLAYVQLPSLPERALARGDLAHRFLVEWGGGQWLDRATERTYLGALRVPFAAHSQLEQLRWLGRSAPRPDGRRFAAGLRRTRPTPVLHLHGSRDGLFGSRAAALTRETSALVGSDYTYELLPGAGHFLAEQEPEHVTRTLLAWLRRVAPLEP
ncbi:alpha/beta fold hydrolase [Cellulomonas sp. CW35]|uniref:Hydrolase n=1 Tax=Cellulomonas uda TaxID=1714 RepID=A0A4Y3KHY8_CELUD|nr:alpha/beta hydrolase [Cellulomonas uda]NII67654.1 pimeloyl-ACP methyl ester carboxylesterase [Cellulomonas uda]GEA82608.1 hydrolase [Cellulomonas uda]